MPAAKNVIELLISAKDEASKVIKKAEGILSGLTETIKSHKLAITITTGSIVAFTKSVINEGDAIAKMAQKTGISTEELSKLKYAADMSNISFEALATGLKKLSLQMFQANKGSKESTELFKSLGIEIRDSRGKIKDFGQILPEIADKFSKMEDGATKAAIAQKLFGQRGIELIPLLNQGGDAIKQLSQEAEKLGIVWSTQDAKAAEEFNDNLTRLWNGLRGLSRIILSEILPSLTSFVDSAINVTKNIIEWEKQNRILTDSVKALWSVVEKAIEGWGYLIALYKQLKGESDALSKYHAEVQKRHREATQSIISDTKEQVAVKKQATEEIITDEVAKQEKLKKLREDRRQLELSLMKTIADAEKDSLEQRVAFIDEKYKEIYKKAKELGVDLTLVEKAKAQEIQKIEQEHTERLRQEEEKRKEEAERLITERKNFERQVLEELASAEGASLELRLQLIDEKYQEMIAKAQELGVNTQMVEQAWQNARLKLEEETNQKIIESRQAMIAKTTDMLSQLQSTYTSIGEAITATQIAQTERRKQDIIAYYDALIQKAQAEGKNVQSLEKQKAEAVKQAEQEIRRAKRAEKSVSIASAIVNAGLAIVRAFSDLGPIAGSVAAAAITAKTAAEIAKMRATPLAKGGIVEKPTLALVGEKGPEAVVPLKESKFMGTLNIERIEIMPNVTNVEALFSMPDYVLERWIKQKLLPAFDRFARQGLMERITTV